MCIRDRITIQLEELLVAGNYDEAKLLLEPSQPVDIADAIGSLPLIPVSYTHLTLPTIYSV